MDPCVPHICTPSPPSPALPVWCAPDQPREHINVPAVVIPCSPSASGTSCTPLLHAPPTVPAPSPHCQCLPTTCCSKLVLLSSPSPTCEPPFPSSPTCPLLPGGSTPFPLTIRFPAAASWVIRLSSVTREALKLAPTSRKVGRPPYRGSAAETTGQGAMWRMGMSRCQAGAFASK